jgi:GNAT superfamily N-acetyltransferase
VAKEDLADLTAAKDWVVSLRDNPERVSVEGAGQLFQVDVPEAHELLDYDEPLSKQSKHIQDIGREVLAALGYENVEEYLKTVTGVGLYEKIQLLKHKAERAAGRDGGMNPEYASRFLLERGIPGLRYLDHGSRDADAKQTHNFVIWDDSRVEVKKKFYQGGKEDLDAIRADAEAQGVKLDLFEREKVITIPRIVVPEGSRGAGVGTKLMERVLAYADASGKTVALTPSTDFGGSSKARLERFYKRLGFVSNKGKARNLEISESMYREPQAPSAPARGEAFKSWFKDSKVVDEKGAPRVVYHGSNYSGFDTFQKELQDPNSLYGPGFYFTEDASIASSYTEKDARLAEKKGESPGVYPVYLSIQSPLDAAKPASTYVAQLQKFKAKAPPANIKRMIDSALREESENFSLSGLAMWAENTEWAYNEIEKSGKSADDLLGPHFDYVLSKARDYLVKQVRAGEMKTGDDLIQFIRRNVFDFPSEEKGDSNIKDVLTRLGFDGIAHVGGNIMGDGHEHQVWIAFNPEQVKSATGNRGTFDPNDPNILHAGDPTNPRGHVELIREGMKRVFNIALSPDADFSTFPHESAHVFLEIFGDLAERPDAPARVRQDYQTLLEWFGVDRREDIQREHHEKFARGFERCPLRRQAPDPRSWPAAFERFKLWMQQVYRDIREPQRRAQPTGARRVRPAARHGQGDCRDRGGHGGRGAHLQKPRRGRHDAGTMAGLPRQPPGGAHHRAAAAGTPRAEGQAARDGGLVEGGGGGRAQGRGEGVRRAAGLARVPLLAHRGHGAGHPRGPHHGQGPAHPDGPSGGRVRAGAFSDGEAAAPPEEGRHSPGRGGGTLRLRHRPGAARGARAPPRERRVGGAADRRADGGEVP